ncbi:PREDICTED: enhancer of split m7 protein-like, partial [Rhagoletis zephyria]|uniref:enhancer of split m7 protein-like n=1 Tax=Rhagoletis zephyria TaxID=28612 RepID=UPI000811A446
MSPTKKLSKPLIEKRRRDRINRCLRLLKELVIDSKRFPVANLNKSRFEKADILEITVKYLMTIQQEERRAFQMGFNTCHQEILKLVQELTNGGKEQDGSNEEAM